MAVDDRQPPLHIIPQALAKGFCDASSAGAVASKAPSASDNTLLGLTSTKPNLEPKPIGHRLINYEHISEQVIG